MFDSTSHREHTGWVTCLAWRLVVLEVDVSTSLDTRSPTTCASKTSWLGCSSTIPSLAWLRTTHCSTTSLSKRRTSLQIHTTVIRHLCHLHLQHLGRVVRRKRQCIGMLLAILIFSGTTTRCRPILLRRGTRPRQRRSRHGGGNLQSQVKFSAIHSPACCCRYFRVSWINENYQW